MAVPSGLYSTVSNGIYLFNVSYPSSLYIITISGAGNLRIYEDDNLYFYKGNQGLLEYTADIIKVGGITTSMCKTSEDYVVTFRSVGLTYPASYVRYKKLPLTNLGWLSAPNITGLLSSDAISDDNSSMFDLPILVGNSRLGASIKVYRDDVDIPPFTPFIRSDYNLTSGVGGVRITDLEATI